PNEASTGSKGRSPSWASAPRARRDMDTGSWIKLPAPVGDLVVGAAGRPSVQLPGGVGRPAPNRRPQRGREPGEAAKGSGTEFVFRFPPPFASAPRPATSSTPCLTAPTP